MEALIFDGAVYLGIVGFFLLVAVLLLGLRVVKIKGTFKWHKRLGIIGAIALSIHALVMCYYYLFA